MEHPLVVRVAIPQTVFNPDATDAEIFCVNVTQQTFSVSAKSESFTTVDEEEGTAVAHGSPPSAVLLAPGDTARVADVKGWEWDGHVGINLVFREESSGSTITKSYDLKSGKGNFTLPSGETGRIIPAIR